MNAPVVEVKRRLDGTEQHFGCDAALMEPGRRAVLIYVLDQPWEVSGVELRAGMRTYAHFWIDRPYNVYHWLDGGRSVGYYFNIGECSEISRERVVWNDYAVDVVITPDGFARVLDEGEVPADLNVATRQLIDGTREHILDHVDELVREVQAETSRVFRG